MTTRIALLRGINVGGRNSVAMADLRRILERLGCGDVRTYIQSGNAVFDAPDGGGVTASSIAAAVQAETGVDARVLVLTADEFRQAARHNPFAAEDGRTVQLFFLESVPPDPDLDAIRGLCKDSERWRLTDAVFYLHAPEGIAGSKLAAAVERRLGVGATARNWRTVRKVLEMAETA